jgi:hypothetical protein
MLRGPYSLLISGLPPEGEKHGFNNNMDEKALYELIDSSPRNIYQQNIFCGFSLHLCLQMCLNMAADLMQLGGVWVIVMKIKEWPVFPFSTGTE